MIFFSKDPSIPKKFYSLARGIEAASVLDRNLVFNVFYSGCVNFSDIDFTDLNIFSFTTPGIVNNEYRLYFKFAEVASGNPNYQKPLFLAFANDVEYESVLDKIFGDEFEAHFEGIDETNLTIGDAGNPFSIPANIFYTDIADTALNDYSTDFYNVLYLNGNPQKSTTPYMENVTLNTNNTSLVDIAFKQVKTGAIHPDPVGVDNKFNSAPIDGATLNLWYDSFSFVDPETSEEFLALRFSNFKVSTTPRILIAEILNVNTATVSYAYIPKDISQTATGLYYRINEDEPYIILIPKQYFTTLIGSNSPSTFNVKFYFALPLEENNAFDASASTLSKRYSIPYSNLQPVTSDFKIFLLNTARGTIVEVTSLSNSIVGDIYNINYESNYLELYNIQLNLLNENTDVFITGLYYSPPVALDFTTDMANTIATYGTKGATYIQQNVTSASDLPNTLYIYAFASPQNVDFSSYYNSDAKLKTISQIQETTIRFLLSSSGTLATTVDTSNKSNLENYRYILVGYATRNGTNYSFTATDVDFLAAFTSFNQFLDQDFTSFANHINNTNNPHNVTAAQLGIVIPESNEYFAGTGLNLNVDTFSHADTSTQNSVNNTGNNVIQSIAIDGFGHITSMSSLDVGTISGTEYFAGTGLDLSTNTFSHTDTSTQATVSNSGNTSIQSITLDDFGHVTALTSVTPSYSIDDLTNVDITTTPVITNDILKYNGTQFVPAKIIESFILACSDETTNLTVGPAKVTFRIPYAFLIQEVRASVSTAPVGSDITIDVNVNGTSIYFAGGIFIQDGNKTSTISTVIPNQIGGSLADDDEITIDVDTVGSTTPGAGLKVTLIGYKQ